MDVFDAGFDQLLMLEKSLKSGDVNERLDTIYRVAALLEKYPIPQLTNVVLRKLLDLWTDRTNIVRYTLLAVLKASASKFVSLTNLEAALRPVREVIARTNDPIARALSLRLLGHLTDVVHERPDVYHSLRENLDSTDQVVFKAAVFGLDRLCSRSSKFSTDLCAKLTRMINETASSEVPIELVMLLRHMHHDPITTQKARGVCMEILKAEKDDDRVVIIIRCLTLLSMRSFNQADVQTNLVISYMTQRNDDAISYALLGDLLLLSDQLQSGLSERSSRICLELAIGSNSSKIQLKAIKCAAKIYTTILLRGGDGASPVVQLLREQLPRIICTSDDVTVCIGSLVYHMVNSKAIQWDQSDQGFLSTTFQSLGPVISLCNQETLVLQALRTWLRLFKEVPGGEQMLINFLKNSKNAQLVLDAVATHGDFGGNIVNLITEAYASLQEGRIDPVRFIRIMMHSNRIPPPSTTSSPLSTISTNVIFKINSNCDFWSLYLIARDALVTGHGWIASSTLGLVKMQVTSDVNAVWIESLRLLAAAQESVVSLEPSSCTKLIIKARNRIFTFQTHLKALDTIDMPRPFAMKYTAILCEHMDLSLKTIVDFRQSATTRISNQKRLHLCKLWAGLAEKWAVLARSYLDIDARSTKTLELLAALAEGLALQLNVCNTPDPSQSSSRMELLKAAICRPSDRKMTNALVVMQERTAKLLENTGPVEPAKFIQLVCDFVEILLVVPPYFFRHRPSYSLRYTLKPALEERQLRFVPNESLVLECKGVLNGSAGSQKYAQLSVKRLTSDEDQEMDACVRVPITRGFFDAELVLAPKWFRDQDEVLLTLNVIDGQGRMWEGVSKQLVCEKV